MENKTTTQKEIKLNREDYNPKSLREQQDIKVRVVKENNKIKFIEISTENFKEKRTIHNYVLLEDENLKKFLEVLK